MKRTRLNKVFSFLMGLAFLAVVFQPGSAQALTSTGTASLSNLNFSTTVNWLDPTLVDTRGSFSGVFYGTDPVFPGETTDAIDGAPWGPTTASVPGFGNANTTFDPTTNLGGMFAQTNINQGFAFAQGVLSGQFIVDIGTTLLLSAITADYSLAQFLSGGPYNYNDVSVSLILEDFDTGAVIASDQRFFSHLNNGGTYIFSDAGTLTLPAWTLLPGTYNFEAQASTAAAVPEPATLILLGGGLLGLGAFRKRFPHIRLSSHKA